MDMLQLEYFLAVARTGNMTSAAATLNVAQSSISRSISRLEADLGVPLFERSGRGIALSDYGKLYYAHAEAILRKANDAAQELKEIRDRHLGRISVSTCTPRALNPLILQHFSENPDVLIHQRRLTDLNTIKSYIDNGIVDFALTHSFPAGSEYEWQPLINERYYLLVPMDHPFAQQDDIALSQLSEERLIINACDDPDFIESHCIQAGIHPIFSLISEEYELLGPMVERGLGLSFISTLGLYDMKSALSVQHFSKIRVIPIREQNMTRPLGVLSRKDHYISAAAKAFYKKLLAYFKTIEMNMNTEV